jgi:hypothetical protein
MTGDLSLPLIWKVIIGAWWTMHFNPGSHPGWWVIGIASLILISTRTSA